ncbi:protein RIC-3 isoform X1 [Acinonyx jubatus]|uniref:Protein RIC-3 isoform X1 n=2 Tax=Acinonyx jubatus TaxID=32536 RepID=A0A6J2AKV7_ACIJB|nr:protein RIC-3 isoform X1 [Acinonyx jubatus]
MGAAFGKGTDRRTDARTQPRSERDAQKAGTAKAPGPEDAPLGVGRGEGGVSSWQRREAAGATTEAATAVRGPGALVPRASPSAQPRFGRRRPPALRFRFRLASAPVARAAAMAYSTVQRVALASGLVLAVSLLLPKAFLSRGKRQEPPPAPEGKLGRFPPMMHHHQPPSDGQTLGARFQRSHLAEAFAKAKGSGGGTGGGGSGRGLMGQIIPIYGFGIFLYILYILFKLSKGKTPAEDRKCSTATAGNTHRKITNFELVQLQEKLKETEEAMEKLINRVGPNGESRAQTVTSDQEKRLLHQLREITRVMKEGKFTDRPTPEKEAEEAPYMEDWEGYPEETYPIYDLSDCIKRRQETILVDYPDPKEPSAEEIAERMELLEGEESDHLGWGVPTDPRVQEDNSVTSCDPKPETCSCCFHEEEDPAVLAENAGFSADNYTEHEEATKEVWPQDFRDKGLGISTDKAHTDGTLRKRNPQGLELKTAGLGKYPLL